MTTRGRASRCGPALGLTVLAAALTVNAVLGPAVTGVIDYRYGASMTAQGIALDLVSLVVVVPVTVVAAAMVGRGRTGGAVLGLAPAAFTVYMAPQYVLGPEYGRLPGNNERFLPLHLGLLVLGLAVLVRCWRAAQDDGGPRVVAWYGRAALGVAGVILLRWLPAVGGLVAGRLDDSSYRDNPTAFLLVALLDLGLVVPGALAVAGLLRRRAPQAGVAFFALVGWFSLVPLSVAAMAVTMVVRNVPGSSAGSAVLFSVLAVGFLAATVLVYRPVLHRSDGVRVVH